MGRALPDSPPAVSDSRCGLFESTRHPAALFRPGPVPEAARGPAWSAFRCRRDPCSPTILVSRCPVPGYQTVGKLQGSSSQRLQFGCGAKARESSGAFHLAQEILPGTRKVDVIGMEMERVWRDPWKKTFTTSIILPLTQGRRGFIWWPPFCPSCPQASVAER